MEIELIILLLDLLVAGGFGFIIGDELLKDLKKLSAVSSATPIMLFAFTTIGPASQGLDNFLEIFVAQFGILIIGLLIGHFTALVSSMIGSFVKNI
jgi:hypothetical protein